jgi:hypothetical protein
VSTLSVIDAVLVASCTDVAAMVTKKLSVTPGGGVYVTGFTVLPLRLPQLLLEQPVPDMLHVTPEFEAFETVALICRVASARSSV